MLRLGGLAPVRRNVLVPWRGRRLSGAEGDHRRSEQPHQSAPTQRAIGVRIRALIESSNPGSIYADARRVNGLALPPLGLAKPSIPDGIVTIAPPFSFHALTNVMVLQHKGEVV